MKIRHFHFHCLYGHKYFRRNQPKIRVFYQPFLIGLRLVIEKIHRKLNKRLTNVHFPQPLLYYSLSGNKINIIDTFPSVVCLCSSYMKRPRANMLSPSFRQIIIVACTRHDYS